MSSFIKKRDENFTQISAQRGFPLKLRGRYDGNGDFEKFLKEVIADKKLGNIEDRFALLMIPNLLEGDAATWWQIVAQSINTWEEAVKMMREKFTPKKPAYRIYLQVFQKQRPTKRIAKFVSEKIRLFARLPAGKFDEKTQVDMIYALLHYQYRKRLQRDDVASLGELIEKGRSIEKIVAADMKNKRGRKIRRVGQKGIAEGRNCGFCSAQGHLIKNCRKREELEEKGVVCSAREIVEAMNKKLSIKMN